MRLRAATSTTHSTLPAALPCVQCFGLGLWLKAMQKLFGSPLHRAQISSTHLATLSLTFAQGQGRRTTAVLLQHTFPTPHATPAVVPQHHQDHNEYHRNLCERRRSRASPLSCEAHLGFVELSRFALNFCKQTSRDTLMPFRSRYARWALHRDSAQTQGPPQARNLRRAVRLPEPCVRHHRESDGDQN